MRSSIVRKIVPSATLAGLLILLPHHLWAVQWQPLARTGRHHVALDADSVRLTNLSRLAVWLRFTPQGELQRRQAAAEFGHKTYQLHLEYYEIDCSEQTSVLGIVDLLGLSNKRLARMKGNNTLDVIVPGSVLDVAAQKVCPIIEEEAADNKEQPESPDSGSAPVEIAEKAISEENRQIIKDAEQQTKADPANLEAWRELGNAYFDADLPEKAIQAYDRALSIKPADTDILNDQGAMFRQTGNFSRALSNFEKARALDPNNLESIYNIGYVLAFDLNQTDKALTVWKSYLKLDRSSETARQVQSFIDRYGATAGKAP
jgi:hypothetical protein